MLSLRSIQEEAKKLNPQLTVPELAVIHVDDGVSPTLHTRAHVDEITKQSDTARGKMVQTEILRDTLDTLVAQWSNEVANPDDCISPSQPQP